MARKSTGVLEAAQRKKRETLVRATQFAYPRGINSCELKFSRQGRTLRAAMRAYAEFRLLAKLQGRTSSRPQCNRYDGLEVNFMDACVYLEAALDHGIVEFPFARLYPVKGGLYNLSIRRLIDWSLAEDNPIEAIRDSFWNQAPSAKFWVKVAQHKTFEECIELLRLDPNF